MQIPRSYIDNYSDALDAVQDAALERMLPALERIDLTAPNAMELVKAVFAEAMPEYAEGSAFIAAKFYDGIREMQVGEALGADVLTGGSMTQTDIAIEGIFAQTEKAEARLSLLTNRIGYEVTRAAGECTYRNGLRDSRRVRFARVPGLGETCNFCIMLASRGFVYWSKENAGELNHYHAHCRCRVVPSFGDGAAVEGYDTDALYKQWQDSGFRPKSKSGGKSGGAAKQARFDSVADASAYLRESATINELQKRSAEVEKEIKNLGGGNNTFMLLKRAVQERYKELR